MTVPTRLVTVLRSLLWAGMILATGEAALRGDSWWMLEHWRATCDGLSLAWNLITWNRN